MRAILIYFFGFSIPFYKFGVQLIDQIYISIPLVFFYSFVIYFLMSGRYSKKIFFFIITLNFYIFLTTLARVPIFEFLFAFFAFFIATVALAIDFEKNPSLYRYFIKGFIGSAWVTVILVLFYCISIHILDDSQKYLLEPLGYKIGSGVFFGYYRPTIFFLEPAHLSLYLICVYAGTSFVVNNTYQNTILNKLSFLAVILTGSLAGIIILTVFILAKKKSWQKNLLIISILITAFSVLYFFYQDSEIFLRIYRAMTTFSNHNYGSSEGQRIGSMRIIYDIIMDGNYVVILFGTGFSDYTNYLGYLYADSITGSAFKYGKIANSIILHFVSVGMIGMIFTIYVFNLIFRANHIPREYLAIIILIMLSYGTYINYLLWALVIILLKINLASISKYLSSSLHNPNIQKSLYKLNINE